MKFRLSSAWRVIVESWRDRRARRSRQRSTTAHARQLRLDLVEAKGTLATVETQRADAIARLESEVAELKAELAMTSEQLARTTGQNEVLRMQNEMLVLTVEQYREWIEARTASFAARKVRALNEMAPISDGAQ